MVWSVSSYSEIVNEFLSPENLFGSQKSGRFGVRLIVARSSFRLAYNGAAVCVVPTIGGMIVIPLVMCGDSIFISFLIFELAGRLFWQHWYCGLAF